MKRILALILALLCLGAAALAQQVVATGNVNLRDAPSLDGGIITAVPPGTRLDYLGDTSTDDRGVDWYRVKHGSGAAWISSRYSELLEDGEPAPVPLTDDFTLEFSSDVELLNFYRTNLAASAKTLKLTRYSYVPSEAPNRYSDGAVTLEGDDGVACIIIEGPGYSLCGAAVGMGVEAARSAMSGAGLETGDIDDAGFTAYYPGTNDFFRAIDDFGGVIYVTAEGGVVTGIDLESYTG